MAGPVVRTSVVPTGGSVILTMPEYGTVPPSGVTQCVVSRAVSGSAGLGAFTQLYSGALTPTYLDVGDALPTGGPLDPTVQYVWEVADSRGTTQTPALVPAATAVVVPDQLSQILIRLLQGAINSVAQPDGFALPTVTTQMPAGGLQALPFIVVNLDLIQQSEVMIGEDYPNPLADNEWTLFANARRVWRVSVMAADSDERDWYRDFLLASFRVFAATAFNALGYNVSHRFQAVSFTDTNEWEGRMPGFYGSDLMVEIDGVFPVAVLSSYGVYAQVMVSGTTGGVTTVAQIPATG